MYFLKFGFLLLFFIVSSTSLAGNRLLHYEPDIIDLSGTIKIMTFPGPPNYESMKEGDLPEGGACLWLDQAVDVNSSDKVKDEINEPENNIKLIQLVIYDHKDWVKIKDGAHVRIIGTLFRGQTAHHHTRVLLEVAKIYSRS